MTSFFILRFAVGLTSFSKDNSDNFSGESISIFLRICKKILSKNLVLVDVLVLESKAL